jgi:hypothetical protein
MTTEESRQRLRQSIDEGLARFFDKKSESRDYQRGFRDAAEVMTTVMIAWIEAKAIMDGQDDVSQA